MRLFISFCTFFCLFLSLPVFAITILLVDEDNVLGGRPMSIHIGLIKNNELRAYKRINIPQREMTGSITQWRLTIPEFSSDVKYDTSFIMGRMEPTKVKKDFSELQNVKIILKNGEFTIEAIGEEGSSGENIVLQGEGPVYQIKSLCGENLRSAA